MQYFTSGKSHPLLRNGEFSVLIEWSLIQVIANIDRNSRALTDRCLNMYKSMRYRICVKIATIKPCQRSRQSNRVKGRNTQTVSKVATFKLQRFFYVVRSTHVIAET